MVVTDSVIMVAHLTKHWKRVCVPLELPENAVKTVSSSQLSLMRIYVYQYQKSHVLGIKSAPFSIQFNVQSVTQSSLPIQPSIWPNAD
jgi:hypothetical protein